MPSIHDTSALEALFRAENLDPARLRRFRNAFYKHRTGAEGALGELPETSRGVISAGVEFHALRLVERQDSNLDGATKLLFHTADDRPVETVILRIDTGRTTLCVSSQVGCAAGCVFCATARMGFQRNLAAGEILDQVVQAGALLREEGRHARNVVFMGMGEPLHNERQLGEALAVLTSPVCFNHSAQRLLVSTVGIPAAMVRLAREFPRVRQALSLHSVDPDLRARLVPPGARHTLEELRATLAELNRLQDLPVMVEYLLLAGLNDRLEDARALASWLAGLDVHVNLIPYNPLDAGEALQPTPKPAREAFGAELRSEGYAVTLRVSLGSDIAAACGQLAGGRSAR